MDEETSILILQLLQEDVAQALTKQKGKQIEGQFTDGELVLIVMQLELDQQVTTFNDRRMARSIARAVYDDGIAVTIAAQEEARASDDRRFALRLAGHQEPPRPERPVSINHEDKILERFANLSLYDNCNGLQDDENDFCGGPKGESSRSTEALGVGKPEKIECQVCTDRKAFFDVAELPCKHNYCRRCLVRLFEDALTDESLFPPRCCQEPIPLSRVRGFIGSKMTVLFEKKSIEHSDPYRTYCAIPSCSQYVMPDMVDMYIGTCKACMNRTCTLCKRLAHEGVCLNETEEVLEIAAAQGWRRCYRCHTMVELRTGCNHITSVTLLFNHTIMTFDS